MKKTMPIREERSRNEGGYMERAPHGGQYFVIGNNKIIIREHFNSDGKPLISILEKVILEAGR